jgi:hypothetical protein
MKEITLTKEQYKRLPYKGSDKNKDTTFGEIIGLLRSHGVKRYFMDEETETLTFDLLVKMKDMERNFAVRLQVPHIMYPVPIVKGSKYSAKKLVYLEKESWRMLWWYLKCKLEAIEFGIGDELKEFIPNIFYALEKGGPQINLADTIIENADQIARLKQLPDDSAKPKVIDAEFVVNPE